jgi:hypothetical protein
MRTILTFIFSLYLSLAVAQIDWWSTIPSSGSVSTVIIRKTIVDLNGSSYSIGEFYHSFDFDPDPDIELIVEGATEPYKKDLFIRKLSSEGDFVWLEHVENAWAGDLVFDLDSNLVITGNFQDSTFFGDDLLHSNGLSDAFFSYLSRDGDFITSVTFGGIHHESLSLIGVGPLNELYIVGRYGYDFEIDFDVSNIVAMQESSSSTLGNPQYLYYIMKMSNSGELLKVGTFEHDNDYELTSIDVDLDSNIYVAGKTSGDLDLDLGLGEVITSSIPRHEFILKMNSNLEYQWHKSIKGASSQDFRPKLDVDDDGDLYVFAGYSSFSDGNYIDTLPEGSNGLLMKIDGEGVIQWHNVISGAQTITDQSIILKDSFVYVSGLVYSKLDFDPSDGIVEEESIEENYKMNFIARYSKSGHEKGYLAFKGMSEYANQRNVYFGLDDSNNLYLGGSYTYNVDFDPTYEVAQMGINYYANRPFYMRLNSDIFEADKIEPPETFEKFGLFPNPSNGLFTVQSSTNMKSINIYNSIGQLVFRNIYNGGHIEELDLTYLQQGVYYLVLNEDRSNTNKIIIK